MKAAITIKVGEGDDFVDLEEDDEEVVIGEDGKTLVITFAALPGGSLTVKLAEGALRDAEEDGTPLAEITTAVIDTEPSDGIEVNSNMTYAVEEDNDLAENFILSDDDANVNITGFDYDDEDAADTIDLSGLAGIADSTTAIDKDEGFELEANAVYTLKFSTEDLGEGDIATYLNSLLGENGDLDDGGIAYFVLADDDSSAIYKYTAAEGEGAEGITADELIFILGVNGDLVSNADQALILPEES